MEQDWMEVVWLLQDEPGGGVRGIALCYPNSTLFKGHKSLSKASLGLVSPCICCHELPRVSL